MGMPGFTAEVSLYKTSCQYWMTATNISTGQVVPQLTSLGDCVRSANGCSQNCSDPRIIAIQGYDPDCQDKCNAEFVMCIGGIGEGNLGGAGSPERRVIERSGCFRDRTSSTGWRLRECITLPGASGLATRCNWSDECPAPGCGRCTCTGHTCTQRCLGYSLTGGALTYTRPCTPPPPPGSI